MQRQVLRKWSVFCLLMTLASWLPSFVWDYGFSYWLIGQTFGAVGFVLDVIGRQWWLLLPTFLTANSFFVFMAAGYYFHF